MAIRDSIPEKFVTFENGVDDTTVVDSKEIAGTISKGYNCDLVDDSLVKKRNGYEKKNSDGSFSSKVIRAGIEYSPDDVTVLEVVYGEDATATGTSGELAYMDGVNAPVSIISGLSDANKPTLIQFGKLLFFFNGVDDFVYDGTSTRQIGITAPAAAPTYNTTIDGSLNQNSVYLFCYTYYNSTTGAESTPSEASAQMTTGATGTTDGLRINITAGDATTADTILIYRTVAGGSTFFLEGETDITSTTYDSTLGDNELGEQMELDNSRPDKAKYAVVCDNRIFLTGFTANPNRVIYSKIGQDGAMPESFQVADIADCNPNSTDKNIGLSVADSTVVVLKQNSVGRLLSVDAGSSGLELTGSTKYVYQEISRQITSVSHACMVPLDKYVFWLGKDDIYGTDGAQVLRFGKRIRNTIKNLNFTLPYKFSAVNKTNMQQIIFSVVRSAQVESDFQIVGHYRNLPKIAFTYYSAGTDTTTHPGIRSASMWEVTDNTNNQKVVYFGNSNGNGYIYQMDKGVSDDSSGIYFDVRLPWDAYQQPAKFKKWHSYYTLATGNGNAYNLTHTFEVDNYASIVLTETSSLAATDGSNWATDNWTEFYWASLRYVTCKFFPHRRAKFARYGFQNLNASEPIAIKGVTAVAQIDDIHR